MKSHLKRLGAPKSWKIKRKEKMFVIRPNPGASSFKLGLPLMVVLRDILGYANTSKEAKYILLNQEILVDEKRRKDLKFIVGLMSTISIPKIKQNFRVILNKKGKLELIPLKAEESNIKLCKIINKNFIKKKIQLGLSDGRNLLIEKGDMKVGDSLVIELPHQGIKKHLKFEKGALTYSTSGKHVGEIATIQEIDRNVILCKTKAGEKFETRKENVVIIGKDKSEITIEK